MTTLMPDDATSAAPPSTRPSVFLSYASADRAAARALRDTLAAAGLDVWLDEEELAGGEAWDAKIRNQIRTCTYFMPVISATTEARREGYFRREWRLAAERTNDMADDMPFLLPALIDETRKREARAPAAFFAVEWAHLPDGEVPPSFVRRVKQLLALASNSETPTSPRTPLRAALAILTALALGAAMTSVAAAFAGRRHPAVPSPVLAPAVIVAADHHARLVS